MNEDLLKNKNLCRTCLKEYDELVSIYKMHNTEIPLIDMIRKFINVYEHELIPNQICKECYRKIVLIYDFKQKCEVIEESLRKLVSDIEMKSKSFIEEKKLNEERSLSVENDDSLESDSFEVDCYVCKVCGKDYVQKAGLIAHMRNHTGEKPFLCSYCGRGFVRFDDMAKHSRTHTNERPFVCSVCQKGFKQKFHLTEHERSHNGVKALDCDVCGKKFARYGVLRTHKRTHSNRKPYKCWICEKVFVGSDTLKRHVNRHSIIKRKSDEPSDSLQHYLDEKPG